jgi:hypothetical protein
MRPAATALPTFPPITPMRVAAPLWALGPARLRARKKENGMARPSTFSQETADKIIDRISEGGMLSKICKDEGMPSRKTVYTWMAANTYRLK